MVMPREWLRGAGIAVFLMLAAAVAVGCGEQRPTATVAVSPTPSPTDEPATATSLPQATPSPESTPSPLSTRTPSPPTFTPLPTFTPIPDAAPTATPTYEEAIRERIWRFDWNRSEDVDQALKDSLTDDLHYLAVEFRELFDVLLEKEWIASSHYAPDMEVVEALIGFITETTRSYGSDAVAMQVLAMPFLDDPDEDDVEILSALYTFAQRGEERMLPFLDQLTVDGIVVDDWNYLDLFFPYLKVNEPEIRESIDGYIEQHDFSEETMQDLARLGAIYPEVFWALTDSLSAYVILPRTQTAYDLANIDVQTAERAMWLRFNRTGAYLGVVWDVLIAATKVDSATVNEILDRYSAFSELPHPVQLDLALQLMPLSDPSFMATLSDFDWYRDGVPDVSFTEENLDTGTSVYQELSPEGWAIVYLLGEAIPERSDAFEKLVEEPWLSDDLTTNELSALQLLTWGMEPTMVLRLLDMEFLDDISSEDVDALDALSNARFIFIDDGNLLIDEILSYPQISGELTDSNLRYVQEAIEEAEERIERDY